MVRIVEQPYKPTTVEENLDRKNEMKTRGTLLIALPNKDQLNFHSYQDAKLLMEAIEKSWIQGEVIEQEDINLKLLRSLPSEWKTHALIWRNKAEIETISLDDLYENLKIYEPELTRSSNTSQNPQNVAFVSSNRTISTNEANNTTYGVSTAHIQGNVVNSTSIDNLSDAVICAFLTSQPNSPQLAREDLEQIDHDDLEEMDLKALKNQENIGREYGRKTVPVENPTENALIAQDGIRGYDWSYQAKEEHPTNFTLMVLTSLGSSYNSDSENLEKVEKERDELKLTLEKYQNSSKSLNTLLESQVSDKVKTGLGYKATSHVEESFVKSFKMLENQKNIKSILDKGYHAVPPPYTGNYIPPKPDLMFIDEQVESEFVDVVSTVSSSAIKNAKSKVKVTHSKKEYKEKGFIDSGCPRHMTGNKCYLIEYEDYDGGFVSFGDGKGRISGKGKIKTGTLDFDDVYFYKELKYNLFNVSQILAESSKEGNIYSVDLKSVVPTGGLTCLFPNAITIEYNLWRRRLGHINYKTMNKLVRGNLDETSRILKTFITGIENQLGCKVKVIRCDDRTEFKNSIMNQFCDIKGIKREFSVPRTPQQNGVAERKNGTLIEAARTMLVDSKLPTTFWTEAVNTACYVLNRALVIKPHNKTPYELIRGRPLLIDFMKPIGWYHVVSKATRVFNKRTRIAKETLNIRFLENAPNVKGNGPDLLFDINSLTISINYVPVVAGFQTNGIAGNKDNIVACQAEKKKEPEQEYILIPICTTNPLVSQGPKDSAVDAGKKATEVDASQVSNNGSTNAFEEHPFKRFSLFKNAFSLPHVPIVTPINDIGIFGNAYDDEAIDEKVDMNNMVSSYTIHVAPLIKFLKDQFACYLSQMEPKKPVQALKDPSWVEAIQDELLPFKLLNVWTLVDLPKYKWAIGLQVQQKSDEIFISQDKYVADILKFFGFSTVKTTSTLMEPNKALVKDAEAKDVLWILNQLLNYGFNLMNTKIYIDNESTICIVKNPVFHSKTKHIEIRNHFIRDSYEKKLIQKSIQNDDSKGWEMLYGYICRPTNLVADETVYKEWEDKMKKAATTTSSGNINRTQFMATLNEPLPYESGSGSGPRCQVTILGGVEAQTRFEAAFKQSNDPPLSREKPSESKGFDQIIDFLNAKPIRYALTVNPTVYASCVKQFWTTTKVKKVNDQEQIQALVDKPKVIITKESIRRDLKFDDAEDKQVEGMAKHKEIYVMSSHIKKIFANIRRQGQSFSGNVTPLFETMMVIAQEEKKMKPKRKQRRAAEVHSPSSEVPIEESVSTLSNDPLPSSDDSIQLNELMIFCTSLQQQVLNLEEAKIAQAKEIAKLKKRVNKLEKRRKSRHAGLGRLKKVGASKQVESSKEKDSLGAREDESKQERNIEDIDQDADIALVNEAQGRMHDAEMFGVDDFERNEVFVDVREKTIEKEVSTVDPVTTAGEVVTAASVEDSAAPTTAITADVDNELTLAKTLIAIKAAKPKVISTAITTPRAKGIFFHEQVQAHKPTVSSSKDKGKAKMIEPEKPLKKKDQITLDE
nr:hypothetical protein [Tanacetum cinerariifolium]